MNARSLRSTAARTTSALLVVVIALLGFPALAAADTSTVDADTATAGTQTTITAVCTNGALGAQTFNGLISIVENNTDPRFSGTITFTPPAVADGITIAVPGTVTAPGNNATVTRTFTTAIAAGSAAGSFLRTINMVDTTNPNPLNGSVAFTVVIPSCAVDTTPPVFTNVPANIVAEATSSAGAVVVFTPPTATDAVSGVRTVTCAPASGLTFAIATTTVTCSATDAAGNLGTASFTVQVRDTTGPVFTNVPANIVTEATGPTGRSVAYTLPTATDAVSGVRTVTCLPASGSTFAIATATVTCTATDAAGNPNTAGFTVQVRDTTGPVINVPPAITAEATAANGAVVNYTVTATDAVVGAVTATCTPASGSRFALGTTAVSCTATDGTNPTTTPFNITVSDTTAPVIASPGNLIREATGPGGATVTYTATASDAVAGAVTPTCSPASGTTFAIATTQVTCNATDGTNASAPVQFNVTVVDGTGPVFTTPGNITVAAASAAGSTVNYVVSATDVVSGVRPVTCTPATGALFAAGTTTTVNCTSVDAVNNLTAAAFTVTVNAFQVVPTPPAPPAPQTFNNPVAIGGDGPVGAPQMTFTPAPAPAPPAPAPTAPTPTAPAPDVQVLGTSASAQTGPIPGDTTGITTLPTWFDITGTPPTEVCLPYSEADVFAAGLTEERLRVFHFDRNGVRTDITSRVDTLNNQVCGLATAFSPFALGGATGFSRIAGLTRAATAANISAARFQPGVPVAYLATGDVFADALAAGPRAARAGAPLLLLSSAGVPQPTISELQRLRPGQIVVMGGTNVVAESVLTQLGSLTAGGVTRVGGVDRFATAALLSSARFAAESAPTVYIASGEDFPDALAAGTAAAKADAALLLVRKGSVPAVTAAELVRLGSKRLVLVGGVAAVSAATEQALTALGVTVERISGADRYATSAALSAATFGVAVPVVYVATGVEFADALAATPVAGGFGSPVLLVAPGSVPETVATELRRLAPRRIVVVGGPEAVSVAAASTLQGFIRSA